MTAERRAATVMRSQLKPLVLNALGRGFDFEDVDIAMPVGREVLVDVKSSGLCHTDLLFATHDIVPKAFFLCLTAASMLGARAF
jgi:S-(hydroxymethyl)glutathione dehydrogenase/alcohol dehydrogenase